MNKKIISIFILILSSSLQVTYGSRETMKIENSKPFELSISVELNKGKGNNQFQSYTITPKLKNISKENQMIHIGLLGYNLSLKDQNGKLVFHEDRRDIMGLSFQLLTDASFKIIRPGESIFLDTGSIYQEKSNDLYNITYSTITFLKVTKGEYHGIFTYRNTEMDNKSALSFLKKNQPLKMYNGEVVSLPFKIELN